MTETVERILWLMKLRGDNAHSLEENANLSTSSITAWKKNRYNPSSEAITNLASYFNVSADYLLCLIDDPIPLKKVDISEVHLSMISELSKDKNFVDSAKLYKAIPEEYKMQVCAYILGVATTLGLNIQQILGR